jgi:malonyl-CoA O-methyltransferase
VKSHTVPGEGVIVSSRKTASYPEVTGYFIPTLKRIGETSLAHRFARWLATVQHGDGSFAGPSGSAVYAFDTGQVVRGWVAVLPELPEIEPPLRRACDWLIGAADGQGRLPVPSSAAWSLGRRGMIPEGIHLYVLPPLQEAGRLLGVKKYTDFATKSLTYYLRHHDVSRFDVPNALTHFYAYMQEALLDLGEEERVRKNMDAVSQRQQASGAVPAYCDVAWVCSTGLAQLALVWYRLGKRGSAEAAMQFLDLVQNPSGGFFGSYGIGADYFVDQEISWAAKYYIDAYLAKIAAHFDAAAQDFEGTVGEADGRLAALLRHCGELNGKRVLDAGCGKGRFAARLLQRYPGAHVTGLDISPELLRHVPPQVKTVQRSILDMPFADDAFDCVYCIEALEHVVQIEEGVRELARVLAPGGRFVIVDKNKQLLGIRRLPDWEKWFGREELLALLERHGIAAQAEFIGYGSNAPDGWFVCWSGCKAGGREVTP